MRISLATLQKTAQDGGKLAVLTCYDASFAAVLESAGVDVLLVGDSLGMVLQGHETTLPVTLRDMAYHVASVVRGSQRAFVIADMPFGTFQGDPARTFEGAARLLAAGAQMVKVEGGEPMAETVAYLTARGVPVCGHLGLTPQSVHHFGGYRVQGKSEAAAEKLLADALLLEASGAGMIVLEMIPAALAREVTRTLSIPTIGIGAGPACSGQVLVLYDMLDIFPGKKAKFAKNFLADAGTVQGAVEAYVRAVKAGKFPGPEHSF